VSPTNGQRPNKNTTREAFRIPALEVRQGPNRTLYTFAIDGKELPRVATISRLRRDEMDSLHGYQRTAMLTHITAIRRYIESPDALLPNALVVAFDKRVTFEPAERRSPRKFSCPGTLVIPVDDNWGDDDKPGWIVDGQQRSAAIREAAVDHFPVCVTAFITDNEAEQRSQFILVNNTKPLPKGLIHELLPTAAGALPVPLQLKKFPATLLERLNYDADSPMRHRIKTTTMPEGVIKDNSVLRMLESSLDNGALWRFRDLDTGEGEIEAMLAALKAFWTAVSTVFADAWALPPSKSRLTHGVGIISLGAVMDAIEEVAGNGRLLDHEDYVAELCKIEDLCRWTSGTWEFGDGSQRKWDELQNTPRDIELLGDYLHDEYLARATVRNRRKRRSA
jgi:DGQHR domain-containing protein